jgi:adenosylcobinamide-GDP ribazoletransferase
MGDAVRLAVGTFTRLPVRPPTRVDRDVARGAMLWSPVVGAVLGLLAAVVLDGIRIGTAAFRPMSVVDLLGAALAVALVAWSTRGLHLDGLADYADALGVKDSDDPAATRERRLTVMKAPEIGVFGVLALVLTLLVQVLALAECAVSGFATASCVLALVTGRLALLWACAPRVPSARPEGLGALVAGTVPVGAAVAWTVVVLAGATATALLDTEGPRTAHHRMVAVLCGAVLLGLLAAWRVVRRSRRAFGGITGDVLGAGCELAATVVLVTIAIGIGLAHAGLPA